MIGIRRYGRQGLPRSAWALLLGVAAPAAWAAGSEVVDEAMFSVVVMMVILTTLVTPPVLTVLLRRQAAQAGSL